MREHWGHICLALMSSTRTSQTGHSCQMNSIPRSTITVFGSRGGGVVPLKARARAKRDATVSLRGSSVWAGLGCSFVVLDLVFGLLI